MAAPKRRSWFAIDRILVAAFALLDLSTAAGADAQNGERLSRRWCSACHLVSADQQQASSDAPTFATVGRAPDFTAARLALFLLDPPPKMPNLPPPTRGAADIAEYIGKLGRTK